jgi:hypothetical protein
VEPLALLCAPRTTQQDQTLTSALVVFSDPNSNTSTICSKSWLDTHNASSAPTAYVLCDDTGNNEDFEWQFTSYTSIQSFSIEFSHGWDDPACVSSTLPPPACLRLANRRPRQCQQ